MQQTVQQALTDASLTNLADALRCIDLGAFVAGSVPRWVTYSGLTSSATQILNAATDGTGDSLAATVHAVADAANAPLAMVPDGVGAGEVKIAYDAQGVPTLTFAAAVTGFKILVSPIPKGKDALGLAANLARRI